MISNDTIVMVKNRSAGTVSYRIPEDNIRRTFNYSESKKIPYGELEKLSFQPGGRELMADYLQLESIDVTDELNIHTEQEYWLNEDQIKALILEGSIESFLDCLDFAPDGVIDILKKLAVDLPMQDLNKTRALKTSTGFDVAAALKHKEEGLTTDEIVSTTAGRRVAPPKSAESRYKVVSK